MLWNTYLACQVIPVFSRYRDNRCILAVLFSSTPSFEKIVHKATALQQHIFQIRNRVDKNYVLFQMDSQNYNLQILDRTCDLIQTSEKSDTDKARQFDATEKSLLSVMQRLGELEGTINSQEIYLDKPRRARLEATHLMLGQVKAKLNEKVKQHELLVKCKSLHTLADEVQNLRANIEDLSKLLNPPVRTKLSIERVEQMYENALNLLQFYRKKLEGLSVTNQDKAQPSSMVDNIRNSLTEVAVRLPQVRNQIKNPTPNIDFYDLKKKYYE